MGKDIIFRVFQIISSDTKILNYVNHDKSELQKFIKVLQDSCT